MNRHNNTKPRPLSISLARLTSSVAVASALTLAAQAQVTWEGASGGTPGDGFLWTNPLNWSLDTLPGDFDDVIFANPLATPGRIVLNGDKSVQSLTFTENSYTIGAYGTSNVLNNNTGAIAVNTGVFATLNASYGGFSGINLTGGGMLYLNHPSPVFTADIIVDGPGTTLVHRQEGPTIQYAGINAAQEFGRFDQLSLGVQRTVRNITLFNGGEYRIIGTGNNPEGNYKNIIIGAGGGTLNLAAGYIVQNLDDTGQITATAEAFTKAGKGRLIITGTMATTNPLQGVVNINGGMISLDNVTSQVVGASTTHNRFTGIAGTGATLNINSGGTLMINSGTQAFLDVQTVNLNDGSIIAVNGADHIIGYAASPGTAPGVPEFLSTSMNIPGGATATILTRDLFGVQTQRFPRLRNQLDGSGTLVISGNTNAGGGPRLVIERSAPSATFDGVYRLVENTSLEANPRFNSAAHGGTGTLVNTGKVLAGGDVEFAGFASTLDVRESEATTSVLDYTNNEITVTTTQAGSVNTISNIRGDTAAGTGHLFNYGTLTMGNHLLQISGNNSYQTGFADTASIKGNAVIRTISDNGHLVFSNVAAIAEDAAGRSLTLIKTGQGNTAARDFIVGGGISISNLDLDFGTLHLRGIDGAIGTGFGGAAPTVTINGGANAGGTNAHPSQGLLHLDSNGGHVVGAFTVVSAGNSNDRIVDSATVNVRGNGILRLTSESGTGTTETIGTTNVFGHGTFDLVKTGAPASPVALTISTLTLGANATANFTGTSLGLAGTDASRIVIPGTATGILGAQFHSGNEWAKYDNTIDNGFELGVTAFVPADYTIDATATDAAWAPGQQLKLTSATGVVMSADRVVDRVNTQLGAANQVVNLAGFKLTVDQGGILSSTQPMGYKDGATAAVPSGTAGVTAGTTAAATSLFVHANNTIEFHAPIIDNTAGGSVTFVKSGTGTVTLSHQDRAVGAAQVGSGPFTTATWSSTHTGGWVINDGVINVHRGQYLGATPTTVTLNGGQLEINHPVSNANADTILPGWGHNIVINGNATVGADDNGEANDGSTGDRALVPMGSLVINNNSTMGVGAFSDIDVAYLNGTTINGRATFNLLRNAANANTILGGVVSGSGFDVVGYNAAGGTIVLGGNAADTSANTFNSGLVLYAGTVRLNKANGVNALPDTADAEDVVINGGALVWGPGQYGDLTTTNNFNVTNNGIVGRAVTSPAAIALAGADQIADTADITLLTGTLGEDDRITNETFDTLTQRNGTFNAGLGTITVNTANISGGAVNINRGSLRVNTLNLLPGAPDMNLTTGLPTGVQSSLEIGAGGVSLTGQNIVLGTGGNGGVAGSGGVLRLNGNVSVVGSDLLGGSYGRKGIYVQTGNSMREIGDSFVDLMGGNRSFNIDSDVVFTITAPLTNGGLIKNGGGALVLEPYVDSTFAGPIVVNSGVLQAKGDNAFGIGASSITIANGGTVKLDTGFTWTYNDTFTVSGPGALIPGGVQAREAGALIAESGLNHLTGPVIISGGATLAGGSFVEPSVQPGAGGAPFRIGVLSIEGAGGVTGTGTLTLSGHGDGVIVNGIHTGANAVMKDGAGRWTLSGASTYTGLTTILAGTVRVANGAALGSAGTGTTLYGGSLELTGTISLAEPLSISGDGTNARGAIVNLSGTNTLTGAITLMPALTSLGTTLRSESGAVLNVNAAVSGGATSLKIEGAGSGSFNAPITLGPPAAGDVLVKNGSGTWTLNVANSLNGSTAVNGGTLVLAGVGAKVHALSPLNMGGGTLINSGVAQTVNGLNLNAGGGAINGGAGLSVGIITRLAGATATFVSGTVTAGGTVNANGILGGYATVGNDWARVGPGSVIDALPGASYVELAAATTPDNAIRSVFFLAPSALSVNSLKIAGGTGIDLGLNNLTLESGGILYSNSATGAIAGAGLITGPTGAEDVTVHVTGATLDISAPITGFGGFTKAGSGKLVLSGANTFSGGINVNAGTLSIVGPGGTAVSPVLGSQPLNLNGGTFEVVGNDYDPGAGTLQAVVGPAGGTIRSVLGAQMTLNDLGQFSGSGDITYTGGGRYRMLAGTPRFTAFTGNVTVNGGILLVGDNETIGGRQDQTITLKANSALLNGAATGLGQNGLPNNLVIEGGVEVHSSGGNRAFNGDVRISGTNTIGLLDRDALQAERQAIFNGRVSGTGVTLNVFGIVNSTSFILASGLNNELTGTINLNANAAFEARMPGSMGQNNGDVTVNLNGPNSRFLLRHWQNGDYKANVTVSATGTDINSDRMPGFAGGGSQYLSINNVSVNTPSDAILTFGGGNGYTTHVLGTATMNSNTILNVAGGTGVLFENGINFAGGATTLDKRGGASIALHGASNHTGPTILLGGSLILQGAGGAIPNTSAILLRGGELRVENSSAVNPNRINDAAPISLGGGTLRITGPETIGTVSADLGTTAVAYNLLSETVPSALTLNGFTRATGAIVQLQSDLTATGATTLGSSRVSPRVIIPGQADTTQTIVGLLGNNNLDFVQYDGTTLDGGVALGARDMRNPGTANSPSNYTNDPAETAFNDTVIARLTGTATTTLTANRAIDAIKIEGGANRILALGAFSLRVEGGGILAVGNTSSITGSGAIGLTAGAAVATPGVAELIIGGNNTITVTANVANNPASGQTVALIKTGTGTLNLNSLSSGAYSGGTYIHSGTLNTTVNNALGNFSNPIFLDGGILQLNVPNAGTIGGLGGFGQPVNVRGNALIIADNGNLAGTDNDYAFGSLSINGSHTLSIRGFDSMDVGFSGTHVFAGTPTIDMAQAGSGSIASVVTLSGPITGSGFYVTSNGNTDNTSATLQIGGGAGDTIPNSYVGKLITVQGTFTEDNIIQLNKAPNTIAVTGDIEMNGGFLVLNADNQIAPTSNLVLNRGIFNMALRSQTLASVDMRGGIFTTNATTGAPVANTLTITGNLNVTGLDDMGGLVGINGATAAVTTGFTIGNNTTVNVEGLLSIGTFGRVHLAEGATAAVLNINGGLELTGALLSQNNGAGPNIVRLNSDVTTLASLHPSNLGNSSDSDTFVDLNGTRTFTIADGPAGMDFQLSSVVRNNTSPVAIGAIVKNGPGTMQLQGGGTGNSYTGGTTVNEGTLLLFKTAGVNAIPAGTLTIGDGTGGAGADQVIIRNSNQIADTADVVLAASGLLDLDTFNTSETIRNLAGMGAVTLGPTSVLTVAATAMTVYSGSIGRGGTLTKAGAGTLTLNGDLDVWTINADAGTLDLDADGDHAVLNANNAGTIVTVGVSQTLTALNIGDGATVILDGIAPAPAAVFDGGNAGADLYAAGVFGGDGSAAAAAVVPEPGAVALLAFGALGLIGRRRRSSARTA